MGPMLMIIFFHCLNLFSVLLKLYLCVRVQSLSLPDPGTEPASLAFPSLADRFFTTSATWEARMYVYEVINIYVYIYIYIYIYIYTHIISEKAMAPHSCTLAWRIPWSEEPGRLQSMGSQRVGHD